MINVTQPFLPPLEEFIPYLEKIWKSKWLTNGGPFHQELESKLADFLGVPYIVLFNNGTNALLTAIQAMDLSGEVITTPYTFVATANSIVWNNLTPVFIDIDSDTFNISPKAIKKAITRETSAILGVHVYGNPCDVEEIQRIADSDKLKVVYDAAHAFGVKYKGESILNFGDLSVLSLHATKVFNTFEGGAVVCDTKEMKTKLDQLKNFGFQNETSIEYAGINGKMNDLQAAMGLLQLDYYEDNLLKRKKVAEIYTSFLGNINGITSINIPDYVEWNYAYYPILIDENVYGLNRNELSEKLFRNGVQCRKYFYPLITEFNAFNKNNTNETKIAKDISEKVLCLPLYSDMTEEVAYKISNFIKDDKS